MSSTLSKQELRQPDGFMVAFRKFFDDLSKHTQAVVGIGAVVIVAALAGGLLMNRKESQSEQARDALYRARETLKRELLAIAPTTAPAPDSEAPATAPAKGKGDKAQAKPATPPKPAQLDEEQRLEAAAFKAVDVDQTFPGGVKALTSVASQYAGDRAGFEAQYELGDLYLDHGQAAKAVSWYEQAARSAKSPLDQALTQYALGVALDTSGKRPEAVASFEKALAQYEKAMPAEKAGKKNAEAAQEPALKGDLLLAIARSYEGMNDKAKAISYYDRIISQLPKSRQAKTAELLKGRLQE